MERFTFICGLILLASGLYQGVLAGKPRIITPPEKEHRIREGDELRIECVGQGKLWFSTERVEAHAHEQSESVTYVDSNTDRTVFVLNKTTTADTGWYACAEVGTIVVNDEFIIDHPDENIAWIYVYVENPEKVFAVERTFELISATSETTGVIPCRTTSPDSYVTLDPNPPDGDEGGLSWTYDPKIGFQKKRVGKFDQTIYVCSIRGESDIQQAFSLTIREMVSELRVPKIDKKPLEYVVWGKNLTLRCSVTFITGSSIHLNWTHPVKSIPQTRVVVSESTDLEAKTHTSTLTIVNVTKNDGGKYVCTAHDTIHHPTQDSYDIVIQDPNIPFIDVTSDNNDSLVTVDEGKGVQWVLTIKAYPDEPTWEWFDPRRIKILTSSMVDWTSIYSHTKSEFSHTFCISKVDASYNGDYLLQLTTGNFSKSHTLKLAVEGRPYVVLQRSPSKYGVGLPNNFTCTARGSPLPKISWEFVEYPDFAPSGEFEDRPVSVPDVKKQAELSEITSRVEIVTKAEGRLTCVACSNEHCNNHTAPTSITDPREVFGMAVPQSAATGDNVTLTCHVSLKKYRQKLHWTFQGSSILPKNCTRDSIENEKYVSKLTLQDVEMSANGNYSCIAKTLRNETNTKHHVLKIVEARRPDIPKTLYMNDSTISVGPDQSLTLACYADGAPRPEISWYKEGEQLKISSQYSLNYTDGNQTLRILFFRSTDSGEYSCLAKNRLGVMERSMKIEVEGGTQPATVTLISVICTLIVIIIIVITYMGFKVRRERQIRKELLDAGLTHFKEGAIECLNPDLPLDDQAELLPYDQKWEFPRENLKLGKQLGSGAFGVVMKAEARGICVEGEVTTVAVKMVRRTAEPSYMKALSSELKIMIHLGRHINVLNLLGACTKTILTKRELLVIVEYCHFGNLHHYLQHHRNNFIDQIDPATQRIDPDIGLELLNARASGVSHNKSVYGRMLSYPASPSAKSSYSNNSVELVNYRPDLGYQGEVNMYPDGGILSNNSSQPGWRSNYRGDYKDQNLKPTCTQDLLCWAWQVSRGMEYLSSRNVLHGDLAARNILLAEDNIVKICDFGLAKNMYKDNNYKKKGDTPLPIKWMAVESIRDRIFSTHSDVWSFGIVLWEFFTLARIPYPGMEAEKQYDRLMKGHRLEKPEYATDEIYNLMLDCWQAEPTLRPSFPDLAGKLGALLNHRVKTRYFDLNAPYANMNAAAFQNGQSDYLTMMSSPNHVYCNTPKTEVDPATGYVPMNRIVKSADAGPSVLSPKLTETHFNFVSENNKPDTDSDVESCTESAPMLEGVNDPYPAPVSTHNQRVIKPGYDQNSKLTDEEYCKVAENPHYANLNNGKNSENKLQKGDRDNHVIDVLQEDKTSPRFECPTIKSFTNPSYVIVPDNRVN